VLVAALMKATVTGKLTEILFMSHWPKIRSTVDELVNQQFDTPEFKKLFSVELTPGRVAVYQNHMTFYASNRRDCWAFVAGKAPLDVKRAIWAHEKDELIHTSAWDALM
jgi:hypothetical protein